MEQPFASHKSSETVPVSTFAGKNPVVSGLDDVCVFVFVVQSVDSDFTNYGVIFIIVPVLSILPFPCVCVCVCVCVCTCIGEGNGDFSSVLRSRTSEGCEI